MKAALPLPFVFLLLSACGSGDPESSTPSTGAETKKVPADASPKVSEPEGELTYYFGGRNAQASISFAAKTDVMNIFGTSGTIDGSATVNFQAGTGTCVVEVPVDSLNTRHPSRDNAMKGEAYLDGKSHPMLRFEASSARRIDGGKWEIPGNFTLRGVTKVLTLQADVRSIPEEYGKRWGPGRWVRIRTDFKVDMREYGMALTEQYVGKIDPVWSIGILLTGSTEKPEKDKADGKDPRVEDPLKWMRLVRAKRMQKSEVEELPGSLYRFGTSRQATLLKATTGTVTVASTIIEGYAGLDVEKGTGEFRANLSVYSLESGDWGLDMNLYGKGIFDAESERYVYLKSTKLTRKDDQTWEFKGELIVRGQSRPISLDITVGQLSKEIVEELKWGKETAIGLETSFVLRLSDYGITIPSALQGRLEDEWKVEMDIKGVLISR